MHDKRNKVVTGWQLFSFVLNGMVGVGVFSLARQVGSIAGRGALLAIPLAGLMVIIQLFGMNLLARRFPTQTLNEYVAHIMGAFFGKIYLFFYAMLATALGVIVARSYWPLVSAWTIGRTPQYAFLAPLIVICWNIAKRGVVVTARVVELINYGGLILMIVLMLPIVPVDFDLARPLLDRGLSAVAKGVLPSVFALAGFDIFLIVFPFVQSNRRFGIAALASIVATLFYTVVTLLVLSTLGLEFTLTTIWPLQSYLNRFALSAFERADVVFLIVWTIKVINVITIAIFTGLSCFQGAFPRINGRHLALVLLLLALIGTLIPSRFAWQAKLADIYSMAALFYQGSLPWILWLIAVLRRKGGRQANEQQEEVA